MTLATVVGTAADPQSTREQLRLINRQFSIPIHPTVVRTIPSTIQIQEIVRAAEAMTTTTIKTGTGDGGGPMRTLPIRTIAGGGIGGAVQITRKHVSDERVSAIVAT